MADYFAVRAQQAVDGLIRIPVVGAVDLATSEVLFQVVLGALRRAPHCADRVEIDMSAVHLLDGSGIRVLLSVQVHARDLGLDLRVCGASGLPLEVLEIAGVLHRLGGKENPEDWYAT
jgi:anti-anti-sigma factor